MMDGSQEVDPASDPMEDGDETDMYADISEMAVDGTDGDRDGSGISDMDLYDDILAEEQHKQKLSYEELSTKFTDAMVTIKQLEEKKSELQNTQVTIQQLESSMSSLIKTTRAELLRKDSELARLRNKQSGTRFPRNVRDSRISVRGGTDRRVPCRQRNISNERESTTQDNDTPADMYRSTDKDSFVSDSSFALKEPEKDLRRRLVGSSLHVGSSMSEKEECNSTLENSYSIDSDFEPLLFSSPAIAAPSKDSREKDTNMSNICNSRKNAERQVEKSKYNNKLKCPEDNAVGDMVGRHCDNPRNKADKLISLCREKAASSDSSCIMSGKAERRGEKYTDKYKRRTSEATSDKSCTTGKADRYSKKCGNEDDKLSPSYKTVRSFPDAKSSREKYNRENCAGKRSSHVSVKAKSYDRKLIVYDSKESENSTSDISKNMDLVKSGDTKEKPKVIDLRDKLKQKMLHTQLNEKKQVTHSFSSSHSIEHMTVHSKVKQNMVDSDVRDKHITKISDSYSSKSRAVVNYSDSDDLFDVCAEPVNSEKTSSVFNESLKSSKHQVRDTVIKNKLSLLKEQSKATCSSANFLSNKNNGVEQTGSETRVTNPSNNQCSPDVLELKSFKKDCPKMVEKSLVEGLTEGAEDINISAEKTSLESETMFVMHGKADLENAVNMISDDIGIQLKKTRKGKTCDKIDLVSVSTKDGNQNVCTETVLSELTENPIATETHTHITREEVIAEERTINYQQDVENNLQIGKPSDLSPNSVIDSSPDSEIIFSTHTDLSDTSAVTDWNDPDTSLSGRSTPVSAMKSFSDQFADGISAKVSSSKSTNEIKPSPTCVDETNALVNIQPSDSDVLIAVQASSSSLDPITKSMSTISSSNAETSPPSSDQSTTNCTVYRRVTSETISSISYGDDTSDNENDSCVKNLNQPTIENIDNSKSSEKERKDKHYLDASKNSLQTSLESQGSFGSNHLSEQTSLNTSMLTDSLSSFTDDTDDTSVIDSSDDASYSSDVHSSDTNTTSNSESYYSSGAEDSESNLDSSPDALIEERVEDPIIKVSGENIKKSSVNNDGEVIMATADKVSHNNYEQKNDIDSVPKSVETEMKDGASRLEEIGNTNRNTACSDSVNEIQAMHDECSNQNIQLSILQTESNTSQHDAQHITASTNSHEILGDSDNNMCRTHLEETVTNKIHQNKTLMVEEPKTTGNVLLKTTNAHLSSRDNDEREKKYNTIDQSSPTTANKTESVSDDSGIGSVQTNRSNVLQRLLGVISKVIENDSSNKSRSKSKSDKLDTKNTKSSNKSKVAHNSSNMHIIEVNNSNCKTGTDTVDGSFHLDVVEQNPSKNDETRVSVAVMQDNTEELYISENEDMNLDVSSDSDNVSDRTPERVRNTSGHSQFIIEDEEPTFLSAPIVSDTDIFETDEPETEPLECAASSNTKSIKMTTPKKRASPKKTVSPRSAKLPEDSPDMTFLDTNMNGSSSNIEKERKTETSNTANVFILYNAALTPVPSLTNVVDVSSPTKAAINSNSPRRNAIILSPAKILVMQNPAVQPVSSCMNKLSYKSPSKAGISFHSDQSNAGKNSNVEENKCTSKPVKKSAFHSITETMKAVSSITSNVEELETQTDYNSDLKNENIDNVVKSNNVQNTAETLQAIAAITSDVYDLNDRSRTKACTDNCDKEGNTDNDKSLKLSFLENHEVTSTMEPDNCANKTNKSDKNGTMVCSGIPDGVRVEHQSICAKENFKSTCNSDQTRNTCSIIPKYSKQLCENKRSIKGKNNKECMAQENQSISFDDVNTIDYEMQKVVSSTSRRRSHRKKTSDMNMKCISSAENINTAEATSELKHTAGKKVAHNRESDRKYAKSVTENDGNKPATDSVKTTITDKDCSSVKLLISKETDKAIAEVPIRSSSRKTSLNTPHAVEKQSSCSIDKLSNDKEIENSIDSKRLQCEKLNDKVVTRRKSPRKKTSSITISNVINKDSVHEANTMNNKQITQEISSTNKIEAAVSGKSTTYDQKNGVETFSKIKKTRTSGDKNKDERPVKIYEREKTNKNLKISNEAIKPMKKQASDIHQVEIRGHSKTDNSKVVKNIPKPNKLKTAAQQEDLYKEILNKSPAKSTRSATKLTIERIKKYNDAEKSKTHAQGMKQNIIDDHLKSSGSNVAKSKTKTDSRNVLSKSHPVSIDKESTNNERKSHSMSKASDKTKNKNSGHVDNSKTLSTFESQMEKYEDYLLKSKKNTKNLPEKVSKRTSHNGHKSQISEIQKTVPAIQKAKEGHDVRTKSIDGHTKEAGHINESECVLPSADKSNLSDTLTECYEDSSSSDEEKVLREIYEKDFYTPTYDTGDSNNAKCVLNDPKSGNIVIGRLMENKFENIVHEDKCVVNNERMKDGSGSSHSAQHLMHREKVNQTEHMKRRSRDKVCSPRKSRTISGEKQNSHTEQSSKVSVNKSKGNFVFHVEDTLDGIDYMDNMAADDGLFDVHQQNKNGNVVESDSDNGTGINQFPKYFEMILNNNTSNASIEDGELTDTDEESEVCQTEVKNQCSNTVTEEKPYVPSGNLSIGDTVNPKNKTSPVRFPGHNAGKIVSNDVNVKRYSLTDRHFKSCNTDSDFTPPRYRHRSRSSSISRIKRSIHYSPESRSLRRSSSRSPKHGKNNKKPTSIKTRTRSSSKSPDVVQRQRSRTTSRSPKHTNYKSKKDLKTRTQSRSKSPDVVEGQQSRSHSRSPKRGKRCSKTIKNRTRSRSKSPYNRCSASHRSRTPDSRYISRKLIEKRKSREMHDSTLSVAESPLIIKHRCVARSKSPHSRGRGRRSKSQSPKRHRGQDSLGYVSRNRRSRSTSPLKHRSHRSSKTPPSRGRHRSRTPKPKVRKRSITPRSRVAEHSPYLRGKSGRLAGERRNCRKKKQLRDKDLNRSVTKDILKTPILRHNGDSSSEENEGRYSKHTSEKRPAHVAQHRHTCEHSTSYRHKGRKRHYSTSEDDRLRSCSPECSSHRGKRRRSRSPCAHHKGSSKSGNSSVREEPCNIKHEKHSSCSKNHDLSDCCSAREKQSTKCRHNSGASCYSENENITPPSRRSQQTKTHISDRYR